MTQSTPTPASSHSKHIESQHSPSPFDSLATASTPPWIRFPSVTLALTTLFAAFLLLPRVQGNSRLTWTFAGVAGALLVWQLILWQVAKRRGRTLEIELVSPVKSHYVQAGVQFSIYLYWGWYWRDIYAQLPLVFSQLIFLYTFDALLSWSRGRSWRPGFGPLPIVFSTNFFLWFRDDWFFLQFLMVSSGALGKEFIRWRREGRKVHIFNPSALGLTLFSVLLIATGMTRELSWARELATTIDQVPHIFLMIFLVGLVVQYFFSVTLMTLAAAGMLCVLGLIYTKVTGVYYFVSVNISAAVFLGLHLLMTDPATSPRTNTGRLIFGGLYGAGVFVLFDILSYFSAPVLYSKLLIVPILNLSVPLIERFTRGGIVGKLNRIWEAALQPRKLNLVHMGCWAALFSTMLATGFVEAPHPGNSIPFWKKAFADGKHQAGRALVTVAGNQAEANNSGAAYNELGLIRIQGTIPEVSQSNASAAKYFARACELGDESGCVNTAIQFLFLRERRSDEDAARALDLLEKDCLAGGTARNCFLVGFAYETGYGRSLNKERAIEFFERTGLDNMYAVKGLARIGLSGIDPPYDVRPLLAALADAGRNGDAESCWYIAYMYHKGVGLKHIEEKAQAMMQNACAFGSEKACDALKQPELPPFSNPLMLVPGWATAFPIP